MSVGSSGAAMGLSQEMVQEFQTETQDFDLSTGLTELGGDAPMLEGHLVRNFRKCAARESVPVDSPCGWSTT